MNYKCANAYYFRYINKIGGIESHLYYIAKKYGDRDIAIFYRDGDLAQVYRLKRFIRCIQITNDDTIECDNLFVCFNREVLDQVKAKTKYLVLHGDYYDMVKRGQLTENNLPRDPRIDKYLGVSQLVCDSWKKVTGLDAENVYEPVVLDEDADKPLMFISATRLGKEKGWDRMVTLAKELDKNHVNYTWLVYTDTKKKAPSTNMIFQEPRLDIANKFESFDAYIQLSDNEGFCLSVVEALLRGVPVICTDLPVLKELGLNQSNSIKLKHDMTDIPIDEIRNIWKKKFTYKMPEDRWGEFLSDDKSIYQGEVSYRVRALPAYKKRALSDALLHRIPEPGEIFIVPEDRIKLLLGDNPYEEPFVEFIDKYE